MSLSNDIGMKLTVGGDTVLTLEPSSEPALTVADNDAVVSAKVSVNNDAVLTLEDGSEPTVKLVSDYVEGGYSPVPEYRGSYRVTPDLDGQVLQTAGFRLRANIVVDPIPENYGLITWNGSVLTVS